MGRKEQALPSMRSSCSPQNMSLFRVSAWRLGTEHLAHSTALYKLNVLGSSYTCPTLELVLEGQRSSTWQKTLSALGSSWVALNSTHCRATIFPFKWWLILSCNKEFQQLAKEFFKKVHRGGKANLKVSLFWRKRELKSIDFSWCTFQWAF